MALRFKSKSPVALAVAGILLTFLLQSCFTGVEGTDKINLSKKELSITAPSEEDLFLSSVSPALLGEWQPGKPFLVADDKFRLVAEGIGHGRISRGDTILFLRAEPRNGVDGRSSSSLIFSIHGQEVAFPLEKDIETARSTFTTSELPMLIDLDMVNGARSLLMGKQLWTRTALWYDDSLQYRKGRKFVGVRVEDVRPGNAFFPLAVVFRDTDGAPGTLLMNLGSGGNDSRSFAKLFSLSDPKKNYKNISAEHWAAIQAEELIPGMTKEESRLSRGNPSDVDFGHNYSQSMEIWYYPNGSYLRFLDGILVNFK